MLKRTRLFQDITRPRSRQNNTPRIRRKRSSTVLPALLHRHSIPTVDRKRAAREREIAIHRQRSAHRDRSGVTRSELQLCDTSSESCIHRCIFLPCSVEERNICRCRCCVTAPVRRRAPVGIRPSCIPGASSGESGERKEEDEGTGNEASQRKDMHSGSYCSECEGGGKKIC